MLHVAPLLLALAPQTVGPPSIAPRRFVPLGVEPQVVFVTPEVVPVNPLVWEGVPQEGAAYVGQPRIDDQGNWSLIAALPLPGNPLPIEYVRNLLFLRNGEVWLREGLETAPGSGFVPVSDFSLTQQPFGDVQVSGSGALVQIVTGTDVYTLDGQGLPNANDLAFPDQDPVDLLLVDGQIALAVGDEVDVLPGVEFPANALATISGAAVGRERLLVRGTLDTGPGSFDPDTRVVFEVTDPLGTPTFTKRLSTQAGDVLPGAGFEVSTFAADEADVGYNDRGDFVLSVDVRGASVTTDGAVVRYDAAADSFDVLAREGQPSPLAARDWVSVFNVPVALDDAGRWAFRGRVSGDSSTNAILVRDGAVVAQEGDLVDSITGPRVLQLGTADDNIRMAQGGALVWYGAWNAPAAEVCPDNTDLGSSFAIWEGLFLDDRLLVEAGRTTVRDVQVGETLFFPELVVADLPNTIGGFSLSPDGRTLIVSCLLAEPSPDPCTYSINNAATPYVSAVLRIELPVPAVLGR